MSAPALVQTARSNASPGLRRERLLDACSGVVHLAPEVGQPGAVVAYRRTGRAGAPVVVVLGGISAHRTAWDHDGRGRPSWWPDQVGHGRAINADRFQVLTLDWVGGPDASTWIGVGPAAAGPPASPRVQVRALGAVLDALGVARVHAVVGASFGGMVALAFAAARPGRVGRVVVLSAAHEADPTTTALRSIQRRIIRLGVAAGRSAEALATARALAVIGYRSPEEFRVRFHGAAELDERGVRHRVDAYLDHVGRAIVERFDAGSYLALSEGLDLHRVQPEAIEVPVFAWGVRSDQIVPMHQMEALVSRVTGPARLERAVSIYGHDAFLKEARAVARFLSAALVDELPIWKEVRA